MSISYNDRHPGALSPDAIPFDLTAIKQKMLLLSAWFGEYQISYFVYHEDDRYKLRVSTENHAYNRHCELILDDNVLSRDTYAAAIYNALKEELAQERIVQEARRILVQ